MCGIAGLLDHARGAPPGWIDPFTDALAHRGPDGRGTWVEGPVALGHRRLAILDPTPQGACPMAYEAPDGTTLRVTFNGEIYNFLELRDELRRDGYRFRTETDTEVIAAAWHRWGPACQLRFNGMWAFALWDARTRTLVLSRDRFGVKPLYLAVLGSTLAFASELKAYLALPGFAGRLDRRAAERYFANPAAYDGTGAETALAGVVRVPPGHMVTVTPEGTRGFERWWDTAQHLPAVPARYEEQAERFRELFLDSVRLRMRSDVPIGTSLSGGLDSSSVASGMAAVARDGHLGLDRCATDWQRTFIASFPGHPVDEREFADLVVAHTGARPTYWSFQAGSALRHLAASVLALDDLSAAPAVPVLGIYRTMREHGVVVTLDGHGGDELLAGYSWYRDVPTAQLNEALYRDFHATHLPVILRNYDGCSMANGVEVRSPFLDWRLVTYTMALPPEAKLDATWTKRILRDALVGILPEGIRTRTSKLGFESPLVAWANGPLGVALRAASQTEIWRSAPAAAQPAQVAAIVQARTATRPHGFTEADRTAVTFAYRLLAYVLWCEHYAGATDRPITRLVGAPAPAFPTGPSAS
ncbi:MAG: asparagine synthase (glutamine-hydrolyzing) [Gemmatimonadetes bacterium]|nr:asparagine synthase (glutamine-hydrolyzing) [Gemmatimonadota bacterium]